MVAVGAIAPPTFLAKTLRCFRAQMYYNLETAGCAIYMYAPHTPPPTLRTHLPAGSATPLQIVFLHLWETCTCI